MHTDPISVFEAAAEALRRGDWSAAARLCDPVSLIAFRHVVIGSVTPGEPPPPMTVDEVRDFMPGAPLEVLEYMANLGNHEADSPSQLELQLYQVESIEALHRMSPEEVLASSLRRRANPLHLVDDIDAKLAFARDPPRIEAIGVVREGERAAHVVYHVVSRVDSSGYVHQPDWFHPLTADEQARARHADYGARPYVTTCLRQQDGAWGVVADQLPTLGMRMLDSE